MAETGNPNEKAPADKPKNKPPADKPKKAAPKKKPTAGSKQVDADLVAMHQLKVFNRAASVDLPKQSASALLSAGLVEKHKVTAQFTRYWLNSKGQKLAAEIADAKN